MLQAPCDFNADRTVIDVVAASPKAASAACSEACLVHIYPSGPNMGRRFALSAKSPVLIGRGADPLKKNRAGTSPVDIARASEMPDSFIFQMQRERGEYIMRIQEAQDAAVREFEESVRQVTRIVGSGTSAETVAPAKASFKKSKGQQP